MSAAARASRILFIAGWAGALLLLVGLSVAARGGRKLWFDDHIRLLVHAHAAPPATALMRDLSQIGQPAVLISLGTLIIFWLVRTGRSRTALLFAIVVVGAEILDQLLKLLFHRTRPVPFFGIATPDSYSFPSGHALVSCAFFGSLAAIAAARTTRRTLRMAYYAAAAATAGAIGFSRIYLGVHYPSDVLGGYAAAVVWCFSVVCWRSRPGQGAMGPPG
jgi:undecaprenyl-diphosphatase